MHRLVDIAAGGRSRSIDRLGVLDDSDSGESAPEEDAGRRDRSAPPSNKKRRLAIFESEEQNEDLLPIGTTHVETEGQLNCLSIFK